MIELSHLEQRAIRYLNYKGDVTEEQVMLLRSAMNDMKRVARPQFVVRYLALKEDTSGHLFVDAPINISFDSLQKLFRSKESDSLCILVSTLGPAVDKRTSQLAERDAGKMVLFDACANAYIEEVTNDYQKKLNLGGETFRFAPGYGDVPLAIQREIFEYMPEISKIGIELDDSNLMHPFKSMTGFIGFKSGK
ncbi:MAG: hypothetical protein MJ093_08385 [Saccharofermentans sp.]|nr:hypothetical protein [Saccharofermentans sp.]